MDLETLLRQYDIKPHQVIKFDSYLKLDLSKENRQLDQVDLNDEESFTNHVFSQLEESKKDMAVGGYAEERSLYSRSQLFEGEEPRTIHLGIDVWTAAGTHVHAPLAGTVHSFANRNVHGDYGPVIILEHQVADVVFHSLYGHLSTDSLLNLTIGDEFKAGDVVAGIGEYAENFHWPPHLHFQVILDMEGFQGDYPGVAIASERDHYLNNCPDPAVFIFN